MLTFQTFDMILFDSSENTILVAIKCLEFLEGKNPLLFILILNWEMLAKKNVSQLIVAFGR